MCRCVNTSYQFMKQSHFSWWMSVHITHGWFGYVKLLAQQIIYTVSQKNDAHQPIFGNFGRDVAERILNGDLFSHLT